MVNGDEWKDKLVEGKKYHIVARFTDEDMIFVKMGVVGIPEYPVFSKNGVNQMLPWRGIDRIEPIE
ncbi:MAG: hypothetical protein WCP36_08405 [Methanomicrobiales archaeon]